MTTIWWRLIPFALCAFSARGTAQSRGAEAEVLFDEGRALVTAGKIAEGCKAFAESQRLDAQVTTLINLASCREKNGELATAWAAFLEAERQTRGVPAQEQLNTIARERAQKLELRVSKLTINVPQSHQIDGLEIKRGDEIIGAARWNRSMPIDGGTYTITARAQGSSPWSTQVVVGVEKDSRTVDIPDLRTMPAPAAPSTVPLPTPPPAPVPERHRSRTLPIVVGAGSLALLGGALGMHLWGDSAYADAKAEVRDQARRDDLVRSANTRRHVAQGLVGGGAIAAGIAVWLLVRPEDDRAPSTASRIFISPTGVAITGAF